MKPVKSQSSQMPDRHGILASLLKKCYCRISEIFEPEVVEVTFDDATKNSGSYTYTVVPHKKEV